MRRFLASEAAGGILLMLVSLIAVVLANSPLRDAYAGLLELKLGVTLGGSFVKSLQWWVNDGLMAIFFLLVGLEIKRELRAGHLSSLRTAALPGLAAVGGMAIPALVYVIITDFGASDTGRAWAVPTATDIAFALGVLALLGSRVPVTLKVFLTALAIIDDLGAIVIIALFYTSELSGAWLGVAAVCLAAQALSNWQGVSQIRVYIGFGVVMWAALYGAGIHPTLAGVATATMIPLRHNDPSLPAPLYRLEHALTRPVAFLIMPIFGFFNAGLDLSGMSAERLLEPLTLGIALGLLVGKPIGVFGASWLAVRYRLATLPPGTRWSEVFGVAILCGIGFTMSLFIGALAYAGTDEAMRLLREGQIKLGVLAGSLSAALIGTAFLAWRLQHRPAPEAGEAASLVREPAPTPHH